MLALQFPFVGFIGGPSERYRNGYLAYIPRLANAAAMGITAEIAPCVLPVVVTSQELRVVASGGLVESALGWDVRFETPSAGKLAHQDVAYDGATGVKVVWLRFPTIAPASTIDLRIYVGKPDLTGTEADPVACWAGFLAAIDLGSGIDHSGNGASLTLTGVSSATLAGFSAGRYDEAAVAVDTLATSTGDQLVSSDSDTLVAG